MKIVRPRVLPPRPARLSIAVVAAVVVLALAGVSGAAPAGEVPVPEPTAAAAGYYHANNLTWFLHTALGLVIPAAVLFTGLSPKLRDLARRIGRRPAITVGVYAVLWVWLVFLLTLPLAYYDGFVIEHAYGLSHQTFTVWLAKAAAHAAVGSVLLALFLWLPYLLLARSPRRWWLYSSLALLPYVFFVVMVYPVWVEPMFNHVGPMRDKALEADIAALAARADIPGRGSTKSA